MGLEKSRPLPLSSISGERGGGTESGILWLSTPFGRYSTLLLHGSCQRIRMEANFSQHSLLVGPDKLTISHLELSMAWNLPDVESAVHWLNRPQTSHPIT
jgi:hypothetical protein